MLTGALGSAECTSARANEHGQVVKLQHLVIERPRANVNAAKVSPDGCDVRRGTHVSIARGPIRKYGQLDPPSRFCPAMIGRDEATQECFRCTEACKRAPHARCPGWQGARAA